jgi:hypothetical protein
MTVGAAEALTFTAVALTFTAVFGRVRLPVLKMFFALGTSVRILSASVP